jgi:superfamily II DNA or RNA helicase
MPTRVSKTGSELFIVDNSHTDWKVRRYLHDWCQLSEGLDIATAYFEIGALLALNGEWPKVDKIRILMGDEVSKRTKAAFVEGLARITCRLDASLEAEKLRNDFLDGVPAIVEAIRSGQIECRVYRKDKFHAKAYITHARMEVVGSAALVGSSNFTEPGLTKNVELNTKIEGPSVAVLQEWYEEHWNNAEDVTPEVLKVIERHVREYSPFDVYAQSLHYLFRDAPSSAREWEEKPVEAGGSIVFKKLDRYQQTGYRNLAKIAEQHNGAFLCDGVGLGKTFIGMMLLERLVRFERQNVVLIVPKAARKAVWESTLKQYCPELMKQAFQRFRIINHTDITRQPSEDVDWPALMEEIRTEADAFVIDEAHHFRNTGVQVDVEPGSGKLVAKKGKRPSRYRRLYHMLETMHTPKKVYLLTATPINNHIDDLRHMIELFSRRNESFFGSTLAIQSLSGHFRRLEKQLEKRMEQKYGETDAVETTLADAEEVLEQDAIFKAIVVQRSRTYVRKSQFQESGSTAMFPEREPPKVAEYNVRKTYGKLLDMVETAFRKDQPLFRLGVYYPFAYGVAETAEQKIEANRQKQIVGLVRTSFLKRFESSATAFEVSCERLFIKLLSWARVHAVNVHEKDRLGKLELKYEAVIGRVAEHVKIMDRHQMALFDGDAQPEEDIISEEMLQSVEEVDREQFYVPAILNDTIDDLDQLAEFLEELQKFEPKHDDKLRALVSMLKKDAVLSKHKVLIFTEFADTARYLAAQLKSAGIEGVERIDGSTSPDGRLGVIQRFSPYYNGLDSAQLAADGLSEIRVLISTDVLSEGLNLQDCTRLINYDLHWNPVRLMQRIGRVDRRLNPAVEAKLIADHPDQKKLRGNIIYWNFLPPDDLERLLALYRRVAHKTLRISRVFGIEGQKLLKPDDDFDALKNFNELYEGVESAREKLRLEYERLLSENAQLQANLDAFPGRIFSGRALDASAGNAVNAPAVFFCFALPGRDTGIGEDAPLFEQWTESAGDVRWYLLDTASGNILSEPTDIADYIRSVPNTPRRCNIDPITLGEARKRMEEHVEDSYMKHARVPKQIKPRLVAWMELN